jgi:hypothetical protein
MTRNFGLSPDWVKPPGCHCHTLRQREACYEFCDDQRAIEQRIQRNGRFVAFVLFASFAAASVMVVLLTAGFLK